MKSFEKRKLQLMIQYDGWLHDAKSDLKKLSMSHIKSEATDKDILAVGKAIITLIGPKDEAFLEEVRDIQYYLLSE